MPRFHQWLWYTPAAFAFLGLMKQKWKTLLFTFDIKSFRYDSYIFSDARYCEWQETWCVYRKYPTVNITIATTITSSFTKINIGISNLILATPTTVHWVRKTILSHSKNDHPLLYILTLRFDSFDSHGKWWSWKYWIFLTDIVAVQPFFFVSWSQNLDFATLWWSAYRK